MQKRPGGSKMLLQKGLGVEVAGYGERENMSPSKPPESSERAKRKPWDKLWSLNYSIESGDR